MVGSFFQICFNNISNDIQLEKVMIIGYSWIIHFFPIIHFWFQTIYSWNDGQMDHPGWWWDDPPQVQGIAGVQIQGCTRSSCSKISSVIFGGRVPWGYGLADSNCWQGSDLILAMKWRAICEPAKTRQFLTRYRRSRHGRAMSSMSSARETGITADTAVDVERLWISWDFSSVGWCWMVRASRNWSWVFGSSLGMWARDSVLIHCHANPLASDQGSGFTWQLKERPDDQIWAKLGIHQLTGISYM